MIAGPVLSPCSFHSSWSCEAPRQGHPASKILSRDQLTDQRAKMQWIPGSPKRASPRSRTCVRTNVRRAWRTIARGAAKPWEPSGTVVCETSVAYLRKQSKLALFFDRRQKFCRQTAPVLGSRNGPQNGGQVVRTQANQIETE